MQRVLVIGSPGAGKSTLSRRMAASLELPLIHLDQLFWGPGWVQRPEEEFLQSVGKALEGDAWVMDGNAVSTLARRMERADTLVFLDLPTRVCMWRILKRTIFNYGRDRPDLAPDCPERFDWEFLLFLIFVLRFRKELVPEIEEVLRSHPDFRVVRLSSGREAERWLEAEGVS